MIAVVKDGVLALGRRLAERLARGFRKRRAISVRGAQAGAVGDRAVQVVAGLGDFDPRRRIRVGSRQGRERIRGGGDARNYQQLERPARGKQQAELEGALHNDIFAVGRE